ncbi:tol-pal system protein YbgF [Albidovulum aquaemixtae]|uniref:tol-pal system protein YbgF n=1 Tax=Albidovulum aquaemixtae TaxID=1542388 RepID=UPI003F673758
MRTFLLSLAVGAALCAPTTMPVAAQEQTQTLADIRTDLARLAGDLQALRAELVQGGSSAMQAAGGASALERMNAMEAELSRLTSRTEALQNKIDRVVSDGTNRVGDLEFRLCELEDGCDPANLPITATLGGGGAAAGTSVTATAQSTLTGQGTTGGPELAVSEKADFDRAKAALDAGDYQGAAEQFAAFTQTYTGGPLTGEAQYLRGEALIQAGQTADAARAYLQSFSGQPDGPRAPSALLKLGAALGTLGQTQEACVTLGEVGVRFPTAPEAVEAGTAMRALNCQ